MLRMKEAKHVTTQILWLFKERALIEEEYARKLFKLSKSFDGCDPEIGTMKEALQIVKNELEFSAKSHMNASVQFKSQLETPTHEFLTTQSGMRKNFHGIVDKQLKAKQASFESVNKSRARYISKCKEVNHLMHQKPGLPPKEMDK
ncbi:hypothetical protein BDR26DRAFT_903570, partial [Obelidium mucronatum]